MLIAHETRNAGSGSDTATPVANAIRNTAVELSRWVGPDGCRALLTRAVSRAAQQHAWLDDLQVISHSPPVLAGVDERIQENGANAVTVGLTAVLVRLLELLERLVGPDLTLKLAEQVTADDASVAAQRKDEEQP